jgi:hypothetical protein
VFTSVYTCTKFIKTLISEDRMKFDFRTEGVSVQGVVSSRYSVDIA